MDMNICTRRVLQFIWIEHYRCLKNAQVNLNSKFNFEYNSGTKNLSYKKNNNYVDNIWEPNISVSAVVGCNGSGKSSLLKFIINLCNGSGTGLDSAGNYIVVYQVQNDEKHWFEAYYRGVNELNIKSKDIHTYDMSEESWTNNKTELPRNVFYIYYSDLLGQDTFNWQGSANISTGKLLRDAESDNYEDLKEAVNETFKNVQRKLQEYKNYDNQGDDIIGIQKENDALIQKIKQELEYPDLYTIKSCSPVSKYWQREFRRQVDLVCNKRNVLDKFGLYIPFASAKVIENTQWKTEFAETKEIEDFMEQEILEGIPAFQAAMARAVFCHFLCQYKENYGFDRIIPKELVIKLINDVKNKEKTTLNQVTSFFEHLNEVLPNEIIGNYCSFLKYIANESIYSQQNAFKHFAYEQTFTLGLDGSDACDIKDLNSWHQEYEKIKSWKEILEYSWNLSSGEIAILSVFSRLYSVVNSEFDRNPVYNNVVVLLDEAETALHPEWQRKFIHSMISGLSEMLPEKNIQLIVATHSPLMLSDIPKQNTVFLKKTEGKTVIDRSGHKETFASNIFQLYNDSFFLKQEGAIGSFAEQWLLRLFDDVVNAENQDSELDKQIGIVGDDFLRDQLKKKFVLHQKSSRG